MAIRELPPFEETLDRLRIMLEVGDLPAALHLLQQLQTPDQADLLDELDEKEQLALLPRLDPATSAGILEELDDTQAAELVSGLSTPTLIDIVNEMSPDAAADLLGDIAPGQAEAILSGLVDPDELRPLLLHADTSAGGLMTSEFLALRRQMTAADALQAFRAWKPKTESAYHLFVIDRHGLLVGVVNLRQLLLAEPDERVGELMDPDVISVHAGTDQEECAQIMSRYDLLALPVVDANNVLLGVITVDDVLEVLEEEVTEDIQRLGGALPLDRPYLDTPVTIVARKRIGWLLLLFVTESLTGSVLRLFENELQAMVALSFFIPLLIGTGGNAGSQTTSTIIRALAVGEIRLRDSLATLWHETRTGLLLAAGMGLLAFGRALLWGSPNQLALAVSLAIGAIVVWANALGAVLPLMAAYLKIDPTVVSGPAMSTLVDATGLFIYFTVARVVIGL